MAYNIKDGRIIATLLDFDLATFPDKTNNPDEAVPQRSVSSPEAPVSVSVLGPHNLCTFGNKCLYFWANGGNEV